MWKLMMTLGILLSVCSFSACNVSEMSTLRELSRPYLGVYDCESLTYGGTERIGDFEYLRLALDYGGDFTVTYRMAAGASGSFEGTYTADPERGEITLSSHGKSRTFPMRRGTIAVNGNFLGKLCYAEFRLP